MFKYALCWQQPLILTSTTRLLRSISGSYRSSTPTSAPARYRRLRALKTAVAMQTDNIGAAERTSDNHEDGYSIEELPKSCVFTTSHIPDPEFPTPESAQNAPRHAFGPRQVRGAMFTWVIPEGTEPHPEVLAISEDAMRTLGLKPGQEKRVEFKHLMAGNLLVDGIMPWAAVYGGWQFGQWAGQLGDGRAISLFECTNPKTGQRYEVQLKGAGLTPYSRFADGKAVLRSSIREFVISEALHALGIPTTRALALTLLPSKKAVREVVEPCAIVTRFAPTWIRIGSFDLFRWRGDRQNLRRLADYVINECFGGEKNLVPPRPEEMKLTGVDFVNRYHRLYREVVRRNARTVAKWQCYGFMNGVLNTDNTHIMGLSLDFGPFSFMDNFNPHFTPNHDDYMKRYSYHNQPTVIWWNLVRLAEDLAELFGSGDLCDTQEFIEKPLPRPELEKLVSRAEVQIELIGEEYKDVFKAEYISTFCTRLGLQVPRPEDLDQIISPTLDLLQSLELDFNGFFRKLSHIPVLSLDTKEKWFAASEVFLQEGEKYAGKGWKGAQEMIAEWLGGTYRTRLQLEERDYVGFGDEERKEKMLRVNPKFVARNWVLQEVIELVEKKKDREVLPGLMKMVLDPFRESWGWNEELERRWCGDPPKSERGLQCSCSS
ncbi:YdiU domain-containing protein [Tirmania nivea]|nr:YdiU domain-containing protein [Tirmania nivea]